MRNIFIDNILENADNLLAELSIYSLREVLNFTTRPRKTPKREIRT